jgi:hypothetical protein
MSTITKPRTLPARLHRSAALWLAGAILAAAVIVVLALTITSSDAEKSVPTAGPAQAAPGQRYDGGPEEGTRDVSPTPPADIHRYDGDPEASTRGPTPFSGSR